MEDFHVFISILSEDRILPLRVAIEAPCPILKKDNEDSREKRCVYYKTVARYGEKRFLLTDSANMHGRFPFDQKFRKFRFGAKWETFFRFTRLENSQKKWNCSEGSPVFPVGTSQWIYRISRLYHQFHAFRGLLSGQASLGSLVFPKNGG